MNTNLTQDPNLTQEPKLTQNPNLTHEIFKNIKTIKYINVKKDLRPFDIIAFSGNDLISCIISRVEYNQLGSGIFSHVGIIVTADILPYYKLNDIIIHLKPNHPYLFESTFSFNLPCYDPGPPNILTGKGKFGVQLRDLEELIAHYLSNTNTKIACCPLINNPFYRLNDESDEQLEIRRFIIKEKFLKIFDEYEGQNYQYNICCLFASIFPIFRKFRHIRNNILHIINKLFKKLGIKFKKRKFCSELVANIYIQLNVISLDFDPKNVVPMDFFGYDRDGLPCLVKDITYLKI